MIGCRPLTNDEIDKLKEDIRETRDKVILILGATTGFRISELLSIKVKDVAIKGAALSQVTVQRKNMKGKSQSRTVLLLDEAKQGIEALIYEHRLQPDHFLFKSQKGANRPISARHAHRVLTTAFKQLGLQGKVATHSMRKYYAAGMYEALGRDLLKTCKALGHKNINSTVDYLSFDTKELDEAALTLRRK